MENESISKRERTKFVLSNSADDVERDNRIQEEFNSLQKLTEEQRGIVDDVNRDPANASKNRYPNVLPVEKTRVKLQKSDSHSSDYINANYINYDNLNKEQSYICCQAPLANTAADFWRMIWEHQIPVIVMLTRLKELNKNKSYLYWPADKDSSESYGNITVKNVNLITRGGITTSVLHISKHLQLEHLEVFHIHYVDWPDFGVPPTTVTMGDLITEVDIRKKSLTDPICVHCSAGIGRTGTFLAIHITLQNLKTSQEPHIDILHTVLNLRKQRHGMVQSESQYKFIYATLLDIVKRKMEPKTSGPDSKNRRVEQSWKYRSLQDLESIPDSVQRKKIQDKLQAFDEIHTRNSFANIRIFEEDDDDGTSSDGDYASSNEEWIDDC